MSLDEAKREAEEYARKNVRFSSSVTGEGLVVNIPSLTDKAVELGAQAAADEFAEDAYKALDERDELRKRVEELEGMWSFVAAHTDYLEMDAVGAVGKPFVYEARRGDEGCPETEFESAIREAMKNE